MWPTPENFRRYDNGKNLPDQLKVWKVQQMAKPEKPMAASGGAVSHPFEENKAPGWEPIVPGINTGKMSGALGVTRQANFLQWGFSAAPSKMTPAGQNFFLNCIVYISKFKGKSIQSPE